MVYSRNNQFYKNLKDIIIINNKTVKQFIIWPKMLIFKPDLYFLKRDYFNYNSIETINELNNSNDLLNKQIILIKENIFNELNKYILRIEFQIINYYLDIKKRNKERNKERQEINLLKEKINKQNKLIIEIKRELLNKEIVKEFNKNLLNNINQLNNKTNEIIIFINNFKEINNLKKTNRLNFERFKYEKESKKEIERVLKKKDEQIENLTDDILQYKSNNKIIKELNEIKNKYKIENIKLKETIELIKESNKIKETELNVEMFSLKRKNNFLKDKLKNKNNLIIINIKKNKYLEKELEKFSFDFNKLAIFSELFRNEYLKEKEKLKRINKIEKELKEIYKITEELKFTKLITEIIKKNNNFKLKLRDEKENIIKYENQLIESHEIIQMQKRLIENLNNELNRFIKQI